MFKKIFAAGALVVGLGLAAAPQAEARGFYRVAPVRRVAARTVLPPYPVARRVVARPVVAAPIVRPAYRAPMYYGPAYAAPVYSAPVVYGGGVSVNVGW